MAGSDEADFNDGRKGKRQGGLIQSNTVVNTVVKNMKNKKE